MDRRAIVVADVPELVAGQNVLEQPMLLDPYDQVVEEVRAKLGSLAFRLAGGGGIEKASRILRQVQIAGQLLVGMLSEIIRCAARGFNARI